MEAEGSFAMCVYIFPTKGICSFARNTERSMVCTQAKYKTYLASKVLYLESYPAAERGSAQQFGSAASLTKKRWLGKDGPSHDTQPATLVPSAEAIWPGNWADIWKSDVKPQDTAASTTPIRIRGNIKSRAGS